MLYINSFFNFIFKLYIIVLVLPNIKMNPPQVYSQVTEKNMIINDTLRLAGIQQTCNIENVKGSSSHRRKTIHDKTWIHTKE